MGYHDVCRDLSAVDVRSICAVRGACVRGSYLCDFDETRRIIVREHNEE